tara:strand:- start:1939 stop:2646 length:708 start_codon:yes stop_codon:yes gene_type:complete
MIVLLDADSLVWAACYDNENGNYYEDALDAVHKYDKSFARLINEIGELTSIEDVITFSGSRGNFRKYIGSRNTYKANRDNSTIPNHLGTVHSYLRSDYNAVRGYGVETDDMVARAWKRIADDQGRENVLIASIDKDYRQLPCLLYNYHYKHRTLNDISYQDSLYNFYEQMVSGDQSDNVNYFLGKGPSFCKKYFAECKTEYQYIKKLFLLFKERYKSKAREKYIECYSLLRLKTE